MSDLFRPATAAVLTAALALSACAALPGNPPQTAAAAQAGTGSVPADENGQISYIKGFDAGMLLADEYKEWQNGAFAVDIRALMQGFRDALEGKKSPFSNRHAERLYDALDEKIEIFIKEYARMMLEKGRKFLAENSKKPGITTTASGLQYEVKKAGSGSKIAYGDFFTLAFTVSLPDGTVVDDTFAAGGMQIGHFEKGLTLDDWAESLQQMQKGGEYRLYVPAGLVPAELGVGTASGKVPPTSVLVYDIKVVDLEKAPVRKAAARKKK